MPVKQSKCIDCGEPVLSPGKNRKRCPTCDDKTRIKRDRLRRQRRKKANKEAQNVPQ